MDGVARQRPEAVQGAGQRGTHHSAETRRPGGSHGIAATGPGAMNYGMRRLLAAWPWFVVAGVSVVVTLAVMLPAAWIVPQFAEATDGHVELVDPAGSLWKGSGTLMLATGGGAGGADGATLLPGLIEWRTAFWPLFPGHVRMEMRQT